MTIIKQEKQTRIFINNMMRGYMRSFMHGSIRQKFQPNRINAFYGQRKKINALIITTKAED